MNKRIALVAVVLAVAVWCGGQVYAQNNPNVQITAGPAVQNVSGSSATVTWSTNVPSSATVKYGTDPNNLTQTAQEAWGGTNHSVTLKGLQPGQKYYYQVASGQGLNTGTGATSNIEQFTAGQQAASAQKQGVAPLQVLVGPIAQSVTDTSAQVAWETNRPSSTILKYGTSPSALTQTKEKAYGLTHHAIQLSGLQPNTEYYLSVQDEGGREVAKSQFRTSAPGQTAQQFKVTHGPVVEKLGPDSAVIAWTTNAPSSSIVMYGTDPNNLSQRAEAPWGQQTHRVTVNNLKPSTQYWFSVQSGQAQGTGQMAQSQPFPVTTEAPGQSAMNFNTR